MSIEARLYSQLSTYAGLTALIVKRVTPAQLPQDPTLPAVTYLRISTVPLLAHDASTPAYSTARFQVDGWATTFDGMVALRKQIRAAMGAWRVTTVGSRVDVALLVGDMDILEAEPDRWRCTLDYQVSFEED